MECFKVWTPLILAFFFLQNLVFFNNFFDIVIIQIFQPNRKSPLGFDKELLEIIFGHGLVFNFYYHNF